MHRDWKDVPAQREYQEEAAREQPSASQGKRPQRKHPGKHFDFGLSVHSCEKKITVVEATCILVWCYGSPRKLTHCPSANSEENPTVLSNDLVLSSTTSSH